MELLLNALENVSPKGQNMRRKKKNVLYTQLCVALAVIITEVHIAAEVRLLPEHQV